MKYSKVIVALVLAAVGAVSTALTGDNTINQSEMINIAIALFTAAAVFFGPNVPGVGLYTKVIMAGLGTLLMAVQSAITASGGVSLASINTSEWGQIGAAVLNAVLVYFVPNKVE